MFPWMDCHNDECEKFQETVKGLQVWSVDEAYVSCIKSLPMLCEEYYELS